jgi:hypothetical protein
MDDLRSRDNAENVNFMREISRSSWKPCSRSLKIEFISFDGDFIHRLFAVVMTKLPCFYSIFNKERVSSPPSCSRIVETACPAGGCLKMAEHFNKPGWPGEPLVFL